MPFLASAKDSRARCRQPPDVEGQHVEAVLYVSCVEPQHEWIRPIRPKEADRWKSAWSCPNCHVFGRQTWTDLLKEEGYGESKKFTPFKGFATSQCYQCDHVLVWFNDQILYPATMDVVGPHPDMPTPARETYLEAAKVLDASPRAAAALIRLALEELCRELGVTGDLNDAIRTLVKRGLRTEIKKALDVVRVVGNKAIHPGTIDPSDTRERTTAIFALLNMIVDDQISRPKALEAMYEALPAEVKEQIERRDGEPVSVEGPPSATSLPGAPPSG